MLFPYRSDTTLVIPHRERVHGSRPGARRLKIVTLVLVRCVYDGLLPWHEHELYPPLSWLGMSAVGNDYANSREVYA